MTKARDTSKLVSSVGVNTITSLDSTNVNVTTLTVNGNNYPSEGALTNRNIIINGAMRVAQRGTSSTTSGYATVDRFKVNYSSGTVTQTQETLSSGDPFDAGFNKFYRATNTSIASDTAAGFRVIRQNIEDQNIAASGWNYKSSSSYITLSFWVRSSVSQEFYAHLNQGTDSYNYAFSIGTLSANTWTKVTKTIPGNSSLSFSYDNSAGMEVNIVPFWGTNFTESGTTTDSWYAFSGSSRVPDMTSTWATTSAATFDITGVQLEVGEVATPFEFRRYDDELRSCRRYYQPVKIAATNDGVGVLRGSSFANASEFVVQMIEPMRARATGSFYSGSNVIVRRVDGSSSSSSTVNVTLLTTLDVGILDTMYSYIRCRCASGALVDNEPYIVWATSNVVALMDAEL